MADDAHIPASLPVAEADDSPLDLPQLVAALREARESQSEWRHGEAGLLPRPSRDALIAIVKGLRAALFPTHFSGADHTGSSIDFYVGSVLDTTLRSLQEQARRTLSAAQAGGTTDAIIREAQRRVHTFAEQLPHIRRLLELDIRAAYEGDPAAQGRSEVLFCYPGITAIIHHRLAHELYKLDLRLLARVIAEVAHSDTGIDIHPGASIGRSFFIDHGTGVVIGETAIIGDRVRLYQGVTLGARNFSHDDRGTAIKGRPRHPIIEDDVVVYAGATILGRITVGRGSVVGGNVWLTRSLPPQSHVSQSQPRAGSEAETGI